MKPGVYDLPDTDYFTDPALSASGAKQLLKCPAVFRWEQDNGRASTKAFDEGHAAHRLVLGAGADIVVVQADNWMTKAAKEAKAAAYAEGLTPILPKQHDVVQGMAKALREHPLASALLDPDLGGKPEQSLFWHDEQHGIDRRARLDWLPEPSAGPVIIPDYKSAASAEPWQFARAAASYGYHQQADWYCEAVRALGLADDPVFMFIVQEKTAPYVVSVIELDAMSMAAGRRANEQAMTVFRECTETGVWPGYTSTVEVVSLPGWATLDLDGVA